MSKAKVLVVEGMNKKQVTMEEYIEKNRRPPVNILYGDYEIPLIGVIEILASSKILLDSDVLGGGLNNVGYRIIEKLYQRKI